MKLIAFNKTAVGWYNFDYFIYKYNVNPSTFRRITEVSKDAALGSCELSKAQLDALIAESRCVGLARGWEIVPSDDCAI